MLNSSGPTELKTTIKIIMQSGVCKLRPNRAIEKNKTHVTAPQELWVFHQSVLSQFFMKQLVHVRLQADPQLEKHNPKEFTVKIESKKRFSILFHYYYISLPVAVNLICFDTSSLYFKLFNKGDLVCI